MENLRYIEEHHSLDSFRNEVIDFLQEQNRIYEDQTGNPEPHIQDIDVKYLDDKDKGLWVIFKRLQNKQVKKDTAIMMIEAYNDVINSKEIDEEAKVSKEKFIALIGNKVQGEAEDAHTD